MAAKPFGEAVTALGGRAAYLMPVLRYGQSRQRRLRRFHGPIYKEGTTASGLAEYGLQQVRKSVGRIKGEKVYDTGGRYVGTIVNGRLVYRSTDKAGVGSPLSAGRRAASARGNRAAAGIWGEEPDIPD